MRSDGQLYDMQKNSPLAPPHRSVPIPESEQAPKECKDVRKSGLPQSEELLILGLILLLLSDRCFADLPLLAALVYVLFLK